MLFPGRIKGTHEETSNRADHGYPTIMDPWRLVRFLCHDEFSVETYNIVIDSLQL